MIYMITYLLTKFDKNKYEGQNDGGDWFTDESATSVDDIDSDDALEMAIKD